MEHKNTVPPSDSSAPISSKSSVSIPSGNRVPIPRDSVRSPDKSVSVRDKSKNEASAIATRGSTGAPLTPLFLRNTGGGEGDRLGEQPIEIRQLAQLPR